MNTQKNKFQLSKEEILLQNLEKQLYSVPKPLLGQKTKEELKQHLFNHLSQKPGESLPFSLARIATQLRSLSHKVITPPWVASAMRTRLKEYAESNSRASWYRRWWRGLSSFGMQKLGASFLLGVFVVMILFSPPFSAPVTYAAPLVYVEDMQGEVSILRDQRIIPASTAMELKEGDIVFTKTASFATLHFFDDTVSRLDQNTSLTLQRISSKSSLPTAGVVELFLQEGRLWTKAIPWFEESHFSIETPTAKADVDKKALFDIKVTKQTTEVAVAESMVDIVAKNEPYAIPKTVVAGYKLSTHENTSIPLQVEKWQKKDQKDASDSWVADNIQREAENTSVVVTRLAMEKAKPQDVIEDNDNPTVNSLNQQFHQSMKLFDQAQQLLSQNGKLDEAMQQFDDFNKSFEIFATDLKSFEEQDPLRADLSRKMFQDALALRLKDFRSFYPDNNIYKAKEVLQDAQLLLASNPTERIHQQFLQATTILFEIEQLIHENNRSVVGILLKRYQSIMNEMLADTTGFDFKQDKNALEFIQNMVEHIKHLTALEQQLVDIPDYASMRLHLQQLRKDLLHKFIINAELVPQGIPDHLLYEVKDLYDTYANDQINERDLLEPAVQKIIDKDYEVSFIKPTEGATIDPSVTVIKKDNSEVHVPEITNPEFNDKKTLQPSELPASKALTPDITDPVATKTPETLPVDPLLKEPIAIPDINEGTTSSTNLNKTGISQDVVPTKKD